MSRMAFYGNSCLAESLRDLFRKRYCLGEILYKVRLGLLKVLGPVSNSVKSSMKKENLTMLYEPIEWFLFYGSSWLAL